MLPRSPERARFFSEKERTYVVSTLKEDGAVSQDEQKDSFRWTEVGESAKSPHVWFLAIVLFFNGSSEHQQLTWAHSLHFSGTTLYGLA